ncbi:MAG: CRTAC1 family protein, partial [Ignavibacteriaceae bacterium]|nr:CRTAC1 family protein [Ignavibacteriaceae bacterium]
MKFSLKIIFLSLIISIFSYPQNIRIKLDEIKNPSDNVIRVLDGNSFNDFWLTDANGNLFHFFQNSWKKFDGPKGFISNTSIVTSESDTIFLMMSWDKEWRTHFYKFAGEGWTKLPFIHPLPIQRFVKYNNKVEYMIGNFGSLIKYDEHNITIIKTPIEEHLICAVAQSKDIVWIGTQGNGVLKYDGKSFKAYKIKDQEKTWIVAIWISEKKNIFLQTYHNEIYTLINDSFIKVDNRFDGSAKPIEKFGFVLYSNSGMQNSLSTFYIPKETDVSSTARLKDSTYIFGSSTGKLYKGKQSKQLFFYDLASSFGVAGDARNQVNAAAFGDLNGDNRPELFILNSGYTNNLKVFFNENDQTFPDITALTGLNNLAKNSASFYLSDINEDGKLDIVFMNLIDGRCQLVTAELKNDYFFSQKQTIDFPSPYNVVSPINIRFTDIDTDGDLDINIVRYYGDDLLEGSSFFLENKSWGNFSLSNKKFDDLLSWNTQSIFADFNGDGKNDWFVSNKWRKDQLLLNRGGKWVATNFSDLTFDTLKYVNTVGGTAIDFDIDGDLDLFLITEEHIVRILKNDGKANFTDVTDSLIPPSIFEEGTKAEFKHILNTADFNNDGYPDLFLTIFNHNLSQNFLLLNRQAKYFEDVTEYAGVKLPYSSGVICADVDDDGDIDIFGFGKGPNNLWINMTDDSNFIKIVPEGVYSNRTGVGVKIWVYESGHFNNPAYLRGYTQTGTLDFGYNQTNDDVVHFGVDAAKNYDLKFQFPNGTIKRLDNITAGKTITISETDKITASFYLLPGKLIRYLRQEEVIFYIISFLIGMV